MREGYFPDARIIWGERRKAIKGVGEKPRELIGFSRFPSQRNQVVEMNIKATNQRKLNRIFEQMQTLSRQILFETVPGVIRRKHLNKKCWALSTDHSGGFHIFYFTFSSGS
jgi:hypothetical protein